ncbi:MAG: hypothetical protein GXO43_08910 [Crenarchaeota archaeon]|nr:hypothetical protein [Thermoproteota archaeon]
MREYHVLRYGVIIGLIILVVGLILSLFTKINIVLWIGIYVIISTPITSVMFIFLRNLVKGNNTIAVLALIEVLVVVFYILIAIHVL